MSMRKWEFIVATAACFVWSMASAQSAEPSRITPIVEFSAGMGGDTLAELTFTDGDSQDINAGDGLTVAGGLIQKVADSFEIKYTLGYKFSTSAAENLDVWKSVFPLDVVPSYRSGSHRVGVGLTYHISPKLKVDDDTLRFDNAPGVTVEYAYKFFSIAYTDVDYEINGVSFDASNVMLRAVFGF
jgi:hypothetical protein